MHCKPVTLHVQQQWMHVDCIGALYGSAILRRVEYMTKLA